MWIFHGFFTPLEQETEYLWVMDTTKSSSWAMGFSDILSTLQLLIGKIIDRLINYENNS